MRSTFILAAIVFLSYLRSNLSSPNDALSIFAFKLKADIHNNLPYSDNTTSTHCTWLGVQCESDGAVVHLLLENLSLGGVFAPNTLTRIHQLRVLSLKNNSLTGPIPDLSGLVNLKTLFLDHNFFSSPIPPSIASLHRLRTLDLSYNTFSSTIPVDITNLNKLTYIRLDSNRFTGSIPPFNQSSLNIFNVSFNGLTGPVPVTPTLRKFTMSSFSSNPGLCGEIVRTPCSSIVPFFGKTSAVTPSLPSSPPPAVLLGQTTNLKRSVSRNHKRLGIIMGITIGLFIIISSITCILISVKLHEKKKLNEITSASEIMEMAAAADAAAADAAELVMRMEEMAELEEKVRKLQQRIVMGKMGTLVFCAGEPQVYGTEELMRASAELLGRGSLGITYKAIVEDGLVVCVKRLDAGRCAGTSDEMFERHMEAVGGLRHPNLVPLRAYYQARDERILVYDYLANGSLFALVHGSTPTSSKPMHWTSCLKIAEDIAQGLSYIHQAWRLVHGNLKSSNVLLGPDFEACLADYCLSALSQRPPCSINPDSSAYEPPETCKLNHQPTAKSDVYSFGVILLELLTGKPALEHPQLEPDDMVNWVKSVREDDGGEAEDNRLMMVVEVAVVCRVRLPEQRPTMWEVLKMIQEIKEADGGIEEIGTS